MMNLTLRMKLETEPKLHKKLSRRYPLNIILLEYYFFFSFHNAIQNLYKLKHNEHI